MVVRPKSGVERLKTELSNLGMLPTAGFQARLSIYNRIWRIPLYFGPSTIKNRILRLESSVLSLSTSDLGRTTLTMFFMELSNENKIFGSQLNFWKHFWWRNRFWGDFF